MKRLKKARRVKEKGKAPRSAAPPPVPPPGRTASVSSSHQAAAEQARADQQLLSEDVELPGTYGETKIVLVPVHPFLVHVYWDLGPDLFREILSRQRRARGRKSPRPTLRFYDAAGSGGSEGGTPGDFDVDVKLEAMNWYVHVWKPARSYIVELGLKTAQGRFIPIARSNGARVAPALPSEVRDERYLLVRGDYEEVKPVSGAFPGPPPPAQETPASYGHAVSDFSEPEGWFVGSEAARAPDATNPSVQVHGARRPPAQDISSPVPGSR